MESQSPASCWPRWPHCACGLLASPTRQHCDDGDRTHRPCPLRHSVWPEAPVAQGGDATDEWTAQQRGYRLRGNGRWEDGRDTLSPPPSGTQPYQGTACFG